MDQVENTSTGPVHLFFKRQTDDNHYLSDEIKNKLPEMTERWIHCTSWSELPFLITDDVRSICFHCDELNYSSAVEIVNMVKTLTKLVNKDDPVTIGVSINKEVSHSQIKELQKSGLFGIIPAHTDFGVDETIKGLQAQWANIPYWPKHIIEQLPGYRANKAVVENKEIRLTARQNQILNLVLERGASNKIIARTLNISESTVKLHLGHIFKKYGVKNRTQLAVFARK